MSETNGYISPYVGDGYDELINIPASPGQWSAAQVRIRRLSKDEESLIFARNRLNPTETSLARCYAEVLAGGDGRKAKILGWDIKHKNEKGELVTLPISADTICGLCPGFYDVLLAYIEGTLVTPTGETEAEVDVKNS